jgi:hypothetical protein
MQYTSLLRGAWLHALLQDLSYTVPKPKGRGEQLVILNGISAFFQPGQMAALMGPSGALLLL